MNKNGGSLDNNKQNMDSNVKMAGWFKLAEDVRKVRPQPSSSRLGQFSVFRSMYPGADFLALNNILPELANRFCTPSSFNFSRAPLAVDSRPASFDMNWVSKLNNSQGDVYTCKSNNNFSVITQPQTNITDLNVNQLNACNNIRTPNLPPLPSLSRNFACASLNSNQFVQERLKRRNCSVTPIQGLTPSERCQKVARDAGGVQFQDSIWNEKDNLENVDTQDEINYTLDEAFLNQMDSLAYEFVDLMKNSDVNTNVHSTSFFSFDATVLSHTEPLIIKKCSPLSVTSTEPVVDHANVFLNSRSNRPTHMLIDQFRENPANASERNLLLRSKFGQPPSVKSPFFLNEADTSKSAFLWWLLRVYSSNKLRLLKMESRCLQTSAVRHCDANCQVVEKHDSSTQCCVISMSRYAQAVVPSSSHMSQASVAVTHKAVGLNSINETISNSAQTNSTKCVFSQTSRPIVADKTIQLERNVSGVAVETNRTLNSNNKTQTDLNFNFNHTQTDGIERIDVSTQTVCTNESWNCVPGVASVTEHYMDSSVNFAKSFEITSNDNGVYFSDTESVCDSFVFDCGVALDFDDTKKTSVNNTNREFAINGQAQIKEEKAELDVIDNLSDSLAKNRQIPDDSDPANQIAPMSKTSLKCVRKRKRNADTSDTKETSMKRETRKRKKMSECASPKRLPFRETNENDENQEISHRWSNGDNALQESMLCFKKERNDFDNPTNEDQKGNSSNISSMSSILSTLNHNKQNSSTKKSNKRKRNEGVKTESKNLVNRDEYIHSDNSESKSSKRKRRKNQTRSSSSGESSLKITINTVDGVIANRTKVTRVDQRRVRTIKNNKHSDSESDNLCKVNTLPLKKRLLQHAEANEESNKRSASRGERTYKSTRSCTSNQLLNSAKFTNAASRRKAKAVKRCVIAYETTDFTTASFVELDSDLMKSLRSIISNELPKRHYEKFGLCSEYYKGGQNACKAEAASSLLPKPCLFESDLNLSSSDFQLPHDILFDFLKGKIKRQSWDTMRYRKINKNTYVDVKPIYAEVLPCECKLPKDAAELGCGEDCLNRMMYTECLPSSCPCESRCSNQVIRKNNVAKKLRIFKTEDRGYGVKTDENIRRGTFISEYVGEVVSEKEFRKRMENLYANDSHHFTMNLSPSVVIDSYRAGNITRFVNHSCDPNCVIKQWIVDGLRRMCLFSLRDIEAGEELTYDYKFRAFNANALQRCLCKSKNCTGFIGSSMNGSVSKEHPNKRCKESKRRAPLLTERELNLAILDRVFLVRNLKIEKRHLLKTDDPNSTENTDFAEIESKNLYQFVCKYLNQSSACTSEVKVGDADWKALFGKNLQTFKAVLLSIIKSLTDYKLGGYTLSTPLMKCPDIRSIPLYYDLVQCPIDLNGIKRKVLSNQYLDFHDFRKDIQLLFENVLTYVGNQHEVNGAIIVLKRLFRSLWEKHRSTLVSSQNLKSLLIRSSPELLSMFSNYSDFLTIQDILNHIVRLTCLRLEGILTHAAVKVLSHIPVRKKKHRVHVINCLCGRTCEDIPCVQCIECKRWQHVECVDYNNKKIDYCCHACLPDRSASREVPVRNSSNNSDGTISYISFVHNDLQIRLGSCYYIKTSSGGGSQAKKCNSLKYLRKQGEIFRVEKLWMNNREEKFAKGFCYIRPEMTFHEPNRKFFRNEVLRSPCYKTLPISQIVKECFILDPNTFYKGKPRNASDQDIYVCEFRVDRTNRSFFKLSRNKQHPTNTKAYCFEMYSVKFRPKREYMPHAAQEDENQSEVPSCETVEKQWMVDDEVDRIRLWKLKGIFGIEKFSRMVQNPRRSFDLPNESNTSSNVVTESALATPMKRRLALDVKYPKSKVKIKKLENDLCECPVTADTTVTSNIDDDVSIVFENILKNF